MYRVYADRVSKKLNLGHRGENEARCVVFDLADHMEEFGSDGTWEIVFRRNVKNPAELPYPVPNSYALDTYAVWVLTDVDTGLAGEGRCEVRYKVGDALVKTDVYATTILPSLGDTGEAPTPSEDFIEKITEIKDEAKAAATAAQASETAASEAETNAAGSATAAESSAEKAGASVTAAADSARAAAASEKNADSSAFAASTSEKNTATSEANAKRYADNAAASAKAASTSEANAANSATNAKASEATAAATADSVKTSMEKIDSFDSRLNDTNDKINKLIADNALLDGTPDRYKAVMKMFFEANGVNAMTAAGITELCDKWYTMTRTTWNGWTAFWQPDLSSSSDGTKGGDNAGLICEPSTNTYAGQDDYAGNPLFACIDCNWIVDADTLEPMITAIDGVTDGFERYNPDKLVGVLQQSGWHWYDEKESQYIHGYSGTYQSGHDYCEPLPEAVRASDNSMRSWVVHSKYMSHEVDGKMTSYSGVAPTARTYSHNSLHTKAAVNGAQYSGGCVTDWAFLVLMTLIKYGSMTQSDKLQGCLTYNLQYYVQAAETGVKRVLLRPSEAANLIAGSNILIGTYDSTTSDYRRSAAGYAISGADGCKITAIETVTVNGTTYSAVYVDTDATFDTTCAGDKTAGTTIISTWHWNNGSCDDVMGNDGALANPASGKYPVKIQGIEHIVGGYEVYADVILSLYKDTDEKYYYEPYAVSRSANQAVSITANYVATGLKSLQPEKGSWGYIRKLSFARGIFFGTDTVGGSSSTYARDAFYKEAAAVGLREWQAFCALLDGSGGGLSALSGFNGLPNAGWAILARLSPNGNRGEWAA